MYFHLFEDSLVLDLSGPDSVRYLNARLTNDISTLKTGDKLRAAALSAQGKTEGFFLIIKTGENTFRLICDCKLEGKVKEALTRFIVADRIEVSNLSETHSHFHILDNSEKVMKDIKKICEREGQDEQWTLTPYQRSKKNGIELVAPSGLESEILSLIDQNSGLALDQKELHQRAVAAGNPSFPNEISSKFLFSEASLSDAISFTKGCYVGQEVVEKIDAYARLPYRLVHATLLSDDEIEPGQKVSEAKESIGTLISWAPGTREGESFAFLRIKNKDSYDMDNLHTGNVATNLSLT